MPDLFRAGEEVNRVRPSQASWRLLRYEFPRPVVVDHAHTTRWRRLTRVPPAPVSGPLRRGPRCDRRILGAGRGRWSRGPYGIDADAMRATQGLARRVIGRGPRRGQVHEDPSCCMHRLHGGGAHNRHDAPGVWYWRGAGMSNCRGRVVRTSGANGSGAGPEPKKWARAATVRSAARPSPYGFTALAMR